jgi:hypothetical protein
MKLPVHSCNPSLLCYNIHVYASHKGGGIVNPDPYGNVRRKLNQGDEHNAVLLQNARRAHDADSRVRTGLLD